MSEPITTAPATPVVPAPLIAKPVTPVSIYSFDGAKFKAHLDAVKEEQLKYSGKHNHNPFLWMKKNVFPLEAAYAKGDRSKELYDKAMAVKVEPPIVNSEIRQEVADATPASVEPKTFVQKPQGLNLGKK